jgi:hypothetical protein
MATLYTTKWTTHLSVADFRHNASVERLTDEQIQELVDYLLATFSDFVDGDEYRPMGYYSHRSAAADAVQKFGFTDPEAILDCECIAEELNLAAEAVTVKREV